LKITGAQKNHATVKRAFRPVVKAARAATAVVYCGGKQVALGAVVSVDGYIITKASELTGPAECALPNGRRLKARLVGEDKKNDLGLLKVDAAGLHPIAWSAEKDPPVGRWLATSGAKEDPVAIGVVSVRARDGATVRYTRPAGRGVLGVMLGGEGRAEIQQVVPRSAAAGAKLRPHDTILKLDDTEVHSREELVALLAKTKPGQEVALLIDRDGKKVDVTLKLGRVTPSGYARQNTMGGPISDRRSGFSRVLQHDTVLAPNQCGGPIVGLSGQAVGINIARGGRTESYALPAATVKAVLAKLKAADPARKPTSRPARPHRRHWHRN